MTCGASAGNCGKRTTTDASYKEGEVKDSYQGEREDASVDFPDLSCNQLYLCMQSEQKEASA